MSHTTATPAESSAPPQTARPGAPAQKGRPAPLDPTVSRLTYRQLEHLSCARRRRRALAEGLSEKAADQAAANVRSALSAFRDVAGIAWGAPVGNEMLAKTVFEKGIARLLELDLARETVKRYRTDLRRSVRPAALQEAARSLEDCGTLSETLSRALDFVGMRQMDLVREGDIARSTLDGWLRRGKIPQSPDSLAALRRTESTLQLPPGTLVRFCPAIRSKLRAGDVAFPVASGMLRWVRPHLPVDFQERPGHEQQEIFLWVLDNIMRVRAADPEEEVDRSPYYCKLINRELTEFRGKSFKAPERLRNEVDALLAFKTARREPLGTVRKSRWGSPPSIDAQLRRLEIFFGCLALEGVEKEEMSLAMLLDPVLIRAFINRFEERQKATTDTVVSVLEALAGHTNPEHGFLVQHRALIAGDEAPDQNAWAERCRIANKNIYKERNRAVELSEKGRDPFEPIRVIVNQERPIDAYYAIIDEIARQMPSEEDNLRGRARAARSLIAIRYLLKLPIRAKNLVELRIVPKGSPPTPMRALSRRKIAELWYDEDRGVWVHRQPKSAFKNHRSPATMDVELDLNDTDGYYADIEAWLKLRPVLLNGHEDPGTFLVNDRTRRSKRSSLTPYGLYKLWIGTIAKYGIYNPYTGTGAIAGLKPHGPHSMRHIVATHFVRIEGDFGWAAALLFDTIDQVRKAYAEFHPGLQYKEASRRLDRHAPIGVVKRWS